MFIVVSHQFKDVHLDLTMWKDVDVLSVKIIGEILLSTFLFMKERKNYMDLIFLKTKRKTNMMCAIVVRREQILLLKNVKRFLVPYS